MDKNKEALVINIVVGILILLVAIIYLLFNSLFTSLKSTIDLDKYDIMHSVKIRNEIGLVENVDFKILPTFQLQKTNIRKETKLSYKVRTVTGIHRIVVYRINDEVYSYIIDKEKVIYETNYDYEYENNYGNSIYGGEKI